MKYHYGLPQQAAKRVNGCIKLREVDLPTNHGLRLDPVTPASVHGITNYGE